MRVLVTRAGADAARTAQKLEAAGHEAVVAPVIIIVGTGAPLPSGHFDALLATSANAFGTPDSNLENLRHLPVFAVGEATARAARAVGFRDLRIGEGDAAALATLVRLTLPRPARLLYLAGQDRKPKIELVLAEAGCEIEVVERYRAEAVQAWSAAVARDLARDRIDAALHFSRRSAELALLMARRQDLFAPFLQIAHLCLSEDAATPLRGAGASRITVAARPDEAALLTLLSPPPR